MTVSEFFYFFCSKVCFSGLIIKYFSASLSDFEEDLMEDDSAEDTINSVEMRIKVVQKKIEETQKCIQRWDDTLETLKESLEEVREQKKQVIGRLEKLQGRESYYKDAKGVWSGPEKVCKNLGEILDLVGDYKAYSWEELTKDEASLEAFNKEIERNRSQLFFILNIIIYLIFRLVFRIYYDRRASSSQYGRQRK